MRALIILCLALAVNAGRLGYSYRPRGTAVLSQAIDSPGSLSGLGGPVVTNVVPQAGIHKEFFFFRANEAEFEDPDAARKIAGAIKKSVRVIFIKAPENRAYENALLALAKQAAEQQTAIYLLHKQPDLNELANKFNAVRQNANAKPEVHFVKYRTPEDAVNAQRTIQSEYDSLGGTSQNINGGVADALNFASRSSAPAAVGRIPEPEANYLPSSILNRLRHK